MTSVEELSKSLVREYLSRKGLKKTLSVLDVEMPRIPESISNRQLLAKSLHIERLMKKNKDDPSPLRTMIEVMAGFFIRKGSEMPVDTNKVGIDKKARVSGFEAPIVTTVDEKRRKQQNKLKQILPKDFADTREKDVEEESFDFPRNEVSDVLVAMPPKKDISLGLREKCQRDFLLFEDIEDEIETNTTVQFQPRKPGISKASLGQPIDLPTSISLKSIIFGTGNTFFNSEWQRQSFLFCEICGLEYGLVQFKGGPCGLLASLQAYVLKHLLFMTTKKSRPSLQVEDSERRRALLNAMAEILFRCGEGKKACVVRPTDGSSFGSVPGKYKADRTTEKLNLIYVETKDELTAVLKRNMSQFENPSGNGVILFLYCAILSRGLDCVKSDMDDPGGRLMGMHGYCTQEMVNLLTTGKATSNVFNGEIDLDTGGDTTSLLKGIGSQSDVGLLSLFEHYGSCQVGSYLKSPKYPIWIVCSESHFTVLFSFDASALGDGGSFDLYYYDGLAKQDETIRLTVVCGPRATGTNEDLTSPLELCIQTKWKNCAVNWNGTDPIL